MELCEQAWGRTAKGNISVTLN